MIGNGVEVVEKPEAVGIAVASVFDKEGAADVVEDAISVDVGCGWDARAWA